LDILWDKSIILLKNTGFLIFRNRGTRKSGRRKSTIYLYIYILRRPILTPNCCVSVICDMTYFICEYVICDMWYVIWHMLYDICDMWYVICDMTYVICDMWYVICDMWYDICEYVNMWYVICDMWICDMWYVICDMQSVHQCISASVHQYISARSGLGTYQYARTSPSPA
jgi:hypothetical protein